MIDDIKTFFQTLYKGVDGMLEFRALPSRDQVFIPILDIAAIEEFVWGGGCAHRENLFFGVASRTAHRIYCRPPGNLCRPGRDCH